MAKKDKTALLLLLGKKIRQARLDKGLTQENLAELAGLHATYIGQIERGEKSPSLETIFDVANALSVNLSYILEMPEYKMNDDLAELIVLCSKTNDDDIRTITEIAKLVITKGKVK